MHLTPNFGLEREINISFVRIQRLLVLSLFFFFVRLRNTWRSRSATAPCFGFVVFSRSRLRKTVCSESIQSRLASSLQSVCTSVRFSNGEMCEMSVNQVRCGRVVYFCGITRPTDERERERESVMDNTPVLNHAIPPAPGNPYSSKNNCVYRSDTAHKHRLCHTSRFWLSARGLYEYVDLCLGVCEVMVDTHPTPMRQRPQQSLTHHYTQTSCYKMKKNKWDFKLKAGFCVIYSFRFRHISIFFLFFLFFMRERFC